jgi:hypothetical protein
VVAGASNEPPGNPGRAWVVSGGQNIYFNEAIKEVSDADPETFSKLPSPSLH